jgi:outer membrane protein assembly complex protein YaeT
LSYCPRALRTILAAVVALLTLAGSFCARADAPAADPPDASQRLAAVQIEGRLNDPPQRLVRFLGLTVGAPFGEQDQERVGADLERLGYRALRMFVDPAGPGRVSLRLVLEPVRVVRNVVVRGNWPLFDDEVIRHLTVRTGQRLPPDAELRAFLDEEADTIRKFLANEGYFEATVSITPHEAVVFTLPRGLARRVSKGDWIDLLIRVHLGPSYKLGSVAPTYDHPEAKKHLDEQRLYEIFNHWLRFKVTQMREDARAAEKELHDAGYPAARVLPRFDFAVDADRKSHRIRLPVTILVKRKVEVSFEGNHTMTDRELRAQLTLYSAGAYDDVELAESAKAIQREYQKRGYFEAAVTYRRSHLKRDGEDIEAVVYTVDEGPELKVRRVEIVGENGRPLGFAADELRDKASLETRPFPPFGSIGLGEGGYVTATQLSQDAERLVALYRARGFPAARVRTEVARDPAAFDALGAFGVEVTGGAASRDLFVRFIVDEGRRELVDHVELEFAGAHVKSELDVYKALTLGAGVPYTDAGETGDLGRLRDLYKASGHPYVRIDPTGSTWNAAHDRVVLRYTIDEGPAVKFGEILIRGNFKTSDFVIRRDLPFKTGDPFDYAKREQAERNLQTHALFNAVSVTPVGLNEGRDPVPILVQVQERYLQGYGALTLSLGAATDRLPDYLYAQLTYLWANMFGIGSQLELKGDYSWLAALRSDPVTWGLSARYTDLRVFGPGWRLDGTAFYRWEYTNAFGLINSYGGSLAISRSLTLALRAFVRYDLYLANLNVAFVRLDGSNDTPAVSDNTVTTRAVAGLVWDRRVGADGLPNPLAAVKGWLLSASFGYAHKNWSTDNPFFLVDAQALALVPFKVRGHEFTLLGNLRYAEDFPTNESAVPLVERFFAGGDTTTRGYDTDMLKSEIVRSAPSPLGGNAGFRVVPEGGNLRFLSTVELQFPIARTFLGLPMQWSGAVFWDMGAIANGLDQLRPSDLRHSIGVTVLRILTPVGPLSVEYAYPLTQTLAEERWKTAPWFSHYPGRIHFNWGIPLSRL